MNQLLNYGLVLVPGLVLFTQQFQQVSGTDNLSALREVGTFIVSVLLAWAVKYIRESRDEVRKAKEQLPTKTQTTAIADDVIVIKADLALMTDTLERTRNERNEAQRLLAQSTEALEKTNKLLEEERNTNANWGRVSKENDDKIEALTAEVNMLKEVDARMERLAEMLMHKVMEARGQTPGEEMQ